jgi:UDP-glucuronate 4-epimerase
MTKILITGVAGFIGYHLATRLLEEGYDVVGLDNLNDYYDPSLKLDRLKQLGIEGVESAGEQQITSIKHSRFRFWKADLESLEHLMTLFAAEQFELVCHLAAQAGVRYSIENPHAYVESNISGFLNLLECCRRFPPHHFTYASSSSVYGLNGTMPLSVGQSIAHPVSMYAATKKCNELMAHTYSHLFGVATTGLRFFTVYGPWGRPDMALFLFTKAILANEPVNVFNHGEMLRDFTYIDDIVQGIQLVLNRPPKTNAGWDALKASPGTSSAPYRVYNIGNSNPVKLMDFIQAIEKKLGKPAKINLMPMQPGDVKQTFSDISDLNNDTGYSPKHRWELVFRILLTGIWSIISPNICIGM